MIWKMYFFVIVFPAKSINRFPFNTAFQSKTSILCYLSCNIQLCRIALLSVISLAVAPTTIKKCSDVHFIQRLIITDMIFGFPAQMLAF